MTEILRLINPTGDHDVAGWNHQSARLFAIDAATAAIRGAAVALSDADRHNLASYLQEARSLAIADREDELGFLQAAMEARLSLITPGERRRLWLTAVDALIPSPYRAALVSTENALSLGKSDTVVGLSTLLRDRLLARLGEGSLIFEATAQLRATA